MYSKLKDSAMKKFEEVGEGYGEALYFQGRAVEELLECQKSINDCGNHINIYTFVRLNHTANINPTNQHSDK